MKVSICRWMLLDGTSTLSREWRRAVLALWSEWKSSDCSSRYQHGPAAAIGPPYVYSYHYSNYTQLELAVSLAHSTPIDRLYVPSVLLR